MIAGAVMTALDSGALRPLGARAAHVLRRWADRLDHHGAAKATGWSFTFEGGRGIVFRDDGRGCRLWYLGDDAYEQAHTESDSQAPWIDWTTMTVRRP